MAGEKATDSSKDPLLEHVSPGKRNEQWPWPPFSEKPLSVKKKTLFKKSSCSCRCRCLIRKKRFTKYGEQAMSALMPETHDINEVSESKTGKIFFTYGIIFTTTASQHVFALTVPSF